MSGVELIHGDCLAVMRDLPDASVDAVVTDPPYGLEFMGRDWDAPWRESDVNADAGFHGGGINQTRGLPSFTGTTNPKCLRCKGTRRGRRDGTAKVAVCLCDDGGKFPNVRAVEMRAFGEWCELWTAECLRVLKPGGHLLAFGGTRTWHRLACAVEDAGFEVRDSIAWLYGSGFPKSLDVSKAIDKAAGAEREVVGTERTPYTVTDEMIQSRAKQAAEGYRPEGAAYRGEASQIGDDGYRVKIITAPATDAARTWQGWGTALKPGHEPVVVARKPLSALGILATIGSHLDALEALWQAPEADPTTPTGAVGASLGQTDMSPSASLAATSSSTVTSWRRCWAELCALTSTSTTETTSETTTALRTLSSSLSRLTAESTPASATSPLGSTSLASAVDNLFASAVFGLRATLALSATEPAIASTPTSPQDGAAFQSIVLARKPLAGTVAQSVLAHGTGALNIDGCRIEGDPWTPVAPNKGGRSSGIMGAPRDHPGGEPHTAGRWPANVVLDEDQAAALDEQSGESSNHARSDGRVGHGADRNPSGYGIRSEMSEGVAPKDFGGASRFFYTAKADSGERVKVDGIAHPTVKPLSLMRWLVRLVTPPGGTVLEPFAGSGTTVEACILEGFNCIAIEREADYLPLIQQRINRRRDPVAAIKATGDDGGLFDLLDGGAA